MRVSSVARLLAVSSVALVVAAAWTGSAHAAAPILNPIANMSVPNCGGTADQAITATDADGDPITFSVVSGPTFMIVVTISQGTGTATGNIHLAPGNGDFGTYPASVAATAAGQSDTKSFTITVLVSDPPPVLNQPNNMTVNEGSTSNQTLVATHRCGNPLTFSKVSGPSFMTVTTTTPGTGTATGNINLAPGFSDAGTYAATVRTTNGSLVDDKSFTISVSNVNRPPNLAQPANMSVAQGSTANQTLSATDPDGDPIAFSKVAGPTYVTVTTISPGTGTGTGNIKVAPGFSDAGTASVSVTASDGTLSDNKSLTVAVICVSHPPSLSQPANMSVNEGAMANQTLTATDPDGSPITFAKVSGPTYVTVTTTSPGTGSATGNVNLAPGFSDAGIASVRVAAGTSGPCGGSASASFTISVSNVNRPPNLAQPANMSVASGSVADQALSAVDPDGDPLTFSMVSGPTFMTVTTTNPGTGTGTGNIHLAPGLACGASGTFGATVAVSDGTASDSKSLTITVNNVNRPPVLNQPADMTVTEGTTANQTITGTDPCGQPLTFTKVSGPTFVTVTTVNATTGNINLAPGLSDAGNYTATVGVSNGFVGDSKSFSITVNNSCRPPVLNQPANMTVTEGTTANQTLFGTDACGGQPLTFTKVSGPTFMTVTTTNPGMGTATGNINLAPGFSDAGTYTATVQASNGFVSDTKSFAITVSQSCRPVVLDPIANMTVSPGTTADQTVTASTPDGGPLTFTSSMPAFATFISNPQSGTTRTGNIHVAPPLETAPGDYPSSVTVTEGGVCPGSATRSFTISIPTVGCLVRLDPIADMTVNNGTTADQVITGSDACGNPITFSKVSGPIFVTVTTISATSGNIHLSPGFSDAGNYAASVRASDGTISDTKSFMITVTPTCGRPPVADAGGPYQGFVNVPIQFDGSRSSDPNGGPLTFAWDFGDGATAVGPMPLHTYTALGLYSVALTVSGDCGAATSSTTAEIRQSCDAYAFTRGGNRIIRLNSDRPRTCVQVQPLTGCYRNEDVIRSSIVMKYTGGAVTEIHAIADRTAIDADTNDDGIAEIMACFRKQDLRQLFSGLPVGQSAPTVTLEGDLVTGGRFQSSLQLQVISGGGTTAVTVAPNPLNPEATLTFTTARAGAAKVQMFDTNGRLVRTILDEPSLAAGAHEVKIVGRGSRGESLASGIYFIRGISSGGTFTKTITILK